MLILSRKIGEKIIIIDNIEISVLDIKGDTVKLGVMAPLRYKVYRKEIYDEIIKENQSSIKHISPTPPNLNLPNINLSGWDFLSSNFLSNSQGMIESSIQDSNIHDSNIHISNNQNSNSSDSNNPNPNITDSNDDKN